MASAFSAIAKFCHDYHVSGKGAKACRREGPPARSPHSPSYPGYADGTPRAAFKEIADILGHLSLASTSVYAKLDLESLSKAAMPWPGGAQ